MIRMSRAFRAPRAVKDSHYKRNRRFPPRVNRRMKSSTEPPRQESPHPNCLNIFSTFALVPVLSLISRLPYKLHKNTASRYRLAPHNNHDNAIIRDFCQNKKLITLKITPIIALKHPEKPKNPLKIDNSRRVSGNCLKNIQKPESLPNSPPRVILCGSIWSFLRGRCSQYHGHAERPV